MTRERFHPAALDEFERAALFFNAVSEDLGHSFTDEVRSTVDWILMFPSLGSPVGKYHRRAFVKRFPYAVIYRQEAGAVYILAVAHLRRRPGYWRNRV